MDILEAKNFQRDVLPLLRDILKNRLVGYCETDEDFFTTEYCCTCEDTLGNTFLHKESTQKDPYVAFFEDFYDTFYLSINEFPVLTVKDILRLETLEQEETDLILTNEDSVQEWLNEHVKYEVPVDHFFAEKVQVNLMIATEAESSSDMGSYTVLNDFSNFRGVLEDDCALAWLAQQFGKKDELQRCISALAQMQGEYAGRKVYSDSFIESAMQELENFPHCMGGVTFLLEMPFSDFIGLKKMMKKKNGVIKVGKDVECGLFSPWVGGGSCMELKLDHEIEIPVSMIWDAWIEGSKMHGYDVNEGCGMCSSAWKPCVTLIDTDCFFIYQLTDREIEKRFLSLDALKKRFGEYPDPKDYTLVYEGNFKDFPALQYQGEYRIDQKILEALFDIFNIHHPADFKARSMSVSDVVVLSRAYEDPIAYYCNHVGFKMLSNFDAYARKGEN